MFANKLLRYRLSCRRQSTTQLGIATTTTTTTAATDDNVDEARNRRAQYVLGVQKPAPGGDMPGTGQWKKLSEPKAPASLALKRYVMPMQRVGENDQGRTR